MAQAQKRYIALALLLAVVLVPAPAGAADVDVTVSLCTEAGFDAALAATAGGGTIFFDCDGPATIVVTSEKQFLTQRRIVGDGLITISGGDTTRIFSVAPAVTLTLDGLALTNGRADAAGGGAIRNSGTLMLDGVALIANWADEGGAIYSTGVISATRSVFLSNSATQHGGAIANAGGQVGLAEATLADNQAGVQGGALYSTGDVTITSSVLARNAAQSGGGISSQVGSLAMRATTLSGNRAAQDGGGLNALATLTLEDVTLSDNSAGRDGGGALSLGALTLVNTTISQNRAARNGGGMVLAGASLLRNATFAGNSAVVAGGGLFSGPGGATTVVNTLLATNTGGEAPDCAGTLTSQGNNLIQQPAGCTLSGTLSGNVVGVDPLLGPLEDNGGAGRTHALLPGSPAVDAGSNATCALSDQRGIGRPVGIRCDIGAYEQGYVVNSADDLPDANTRTLACETEDGNGICTLRAAVQQANAVAGVDSIAFDASLADVPIVLTRTGIDNTAEFGDIDITDDLIITGLGAGRTIIDGGGSSAIGGVLHIAAGAEVAISGLTIRGGNAGADTFGGGIRNEGALVLARSEVIGSRATSGGGIANFGRLSIEGSTISGNTAESSGGGIYNRFDPQVNAAGGVLELSSSTISSNSAVGLFGSGGGIDDQGDATLTNVTISGNSAAQDGGGIRVAPGSIAPFKMNNVTIAGNAADADNSGVGRGGGLHVISGSAVFKNTIIAGNIDRTGARPDCEGRATFSGSTLVSHGHNLVGVGTGCAIVTAGGDQIGTDVEPVLALLGPLQDRGGLTLIQPPLSGSPAIDAGSSAPPGGQGDACAPADQREMRRPQGGVCDIGASEALLADLLVAIEPGAQGLVATPLLEYRLRVTNLGPSQTDGVTLVDEVPAGMELVAVLPERGACEGAKVVRCTIGQMAPGSSVAVTMRLLPRTGGSVPYNTSVTGVEVDPNLENNSISDGSPIVFQQQLPLVLPAR